MQLNPGDEIIIQDGSPRQGTHGLVSMIGGRFIWVEFSPAPQERTRLLALYPEELEKVP